jgi:diguanylate cyclase (GGDEF)-like protein
MKKRERELESSQKLLQEIAHRDQLTGLPNRLLFETRLTHAIQKAQRNRHAGKHSIVQVIIMDVDDFKGINDLLGHLGGDQVLVEIGRRLQAEVRESDTIARWGGDEFTCILEEVSSREAAEQTARKILAAMIAPVQVQGQVLQITVSLGYSLFPLDTLDQETLLRYADTALYSAKGTKKSFRAYNESMNRLNRFAA